MWSQWYRLEDRSNVRGFVVRRYRKLDGKTKWESLPSKEYRHLSEQELDALLRRLNASYEVERREAEERYNFDHAYINVGAITKYETFLSTIANDLNHITNTMNSLRIYVFEFFVIKCQIPDPSQWYKREEEWGLWLLKTGLKVATIKKIIGTANAFLRYLSTKVYPEMQRPPTLEPIGRNKLKKKKLSEPEMKREKYIKPDIWKKMVKHFDENNPGLTPHIKLCMAFGLRINEVYGLTKEKFFKGHILVNEQGDKVVGNLKTTRRVTRRPLKTLDVRKVPYWNMSAKEAWMLVKEIEPMSPFTANRKVNELMAEFGHKSHDLRRTFITDMRRKHDLKDVQLAAGHKDPKTTLGYDQDDRELSDELADLD